MPVLGAVHWKMLYVLAGPILDRKYDPEKEHALEYAAKRKTLEVLDQLRIAPDGMIYM